jgi:prepilin-type N-terminal cleavage/methylation domain-containing protein
MVVPTRFSLTRRAGFSIIEVIVVTIVIGIIAASGAAKLDRASRQLQADSEAKRLLAVLRGCREFATSGGASINTGYGVFFWGHPNPNNPAVPLCYEYSPYIPFNRTVPNAWTNALARLPMMGLPDQPLQLGMRSDIERQPLTVEAASEGLQIYFQCDTIGMPDLYPNAQRTNWFGTPITPVPAGSFNTSRVIFWPRGDRTAGTPWAPGFWTPFSPAQYGVTLPTAANDTIFYNRIYVRADVDMALGAKWQSPAVRDSIPQRIWIHPATGVMRLMGKDERRADGSW